MTEDTLEIAEHGASAYRRLACRCDICKAGHNEQVKAYNKNARANARAMKLQLAAMADELIELRAFRDRFRQLAAQTPGSLQ